MTEPLNALRILQAAQAHIRTRMSVKPGWTAGDHDAFWMLRKREEEIMTERGMQFVSLLAGMAGAENIL